ncbi:MAG: hypothetical protein J6O55_01380 [Lachnospiraceae bacterium]|nr:hypothetical protein [Lachnospiraceae bacterium]
MTDYQFDSILGMVDLILAGCDSVEEAREKLAFFRKKQSDGNADAGEAVDK